MQSSTVEAQVALSAKISRVAWDRKPSFIPASWWLFLKRMKVPGTYRVEDLGQIAHSRDGSVTLQDA